jgi:phosphoserine aminotransferase
MLCVEDYLACLAWVKNNGGVQGMINRADKNTKTLSDWVNKTPWIDFLAQDPTTRTNTGVCLVFCDDEFKADYPNVKTENVKFDYNPSKEIIKQFNKKFDENDKIIEEER